jgi:hypothetical protein
MLSHVNRRTWILLVYLVCLVTLAACGSNAASPLDASDGPLAVDGRDAFAADKVGGEAEAGGDERMTAHEDSNLLDTTTIDASIVDATKNDTSVVDARECRADVSELSTRGWIRPCSSLVDAGIPNPTCIGQTPGLRLFRTTCAQREIFLWSWGTHSQECFYDQGTLVGARLQNDTPSFCDNESNGLLIGATEGCPSTPQTLVLNCNPFADSDWQPWTPDAR